MNDEYLIVNVVFNISTNGAFANTGKEYAFISFDDLKENDIVVVDTQYGFQLATVTGFSSKIPFNVPKGRMREIVCKVDFSSFFNRKEKAEKIKQLKAEMDKRVEKLKEDAIYEMMAEKDPTLKALFDEFKALQG